MRILVLMFCATALPLPAESIFDVLASMASALSAGNPMAFMGAISRRLPDYEKLQADVTGLTEQASVLSSVEILKDEGSASKRQVEADWFLEIRPKEPSAPLERRRRTLRIEFAIEGQRWKIVSLEPAGFFGPASPGARGIRAPRLDERVSIGIHVIRLNPDERYAGHLCPCILMHGAQGSYEI